MDWGMSRSSRTWHGLPHDPGYDTDHVSWPRSGDGGTYSMQAAGLEGRYCKTTDEMAVHGGLL